MKRNIAMKSHIVGKSKKGKIILSPEEEKRIINEAVDRILAENFKKKNIQLKSLSKVQFKLSPKTATPATDDKSECQTDSENDHGALEASDKVDNSSSSNSDVGEFSTTFVEELRQYEKRKPCKCDNCGSRFRNEHALKLHEQKVHDWQRRVMTRQRLVTRTKNNNDKNKDEVDNNLSKPPKTKMNEKLKTLEMEKRRLSRVQSASVEEPLAWQRCGSAGETCDKFRQVKAGTEAWFCHGHKKRGAKRSEGVCEVYRMGSLVTASVRGHTPWPGMVDICPDTELWAWRNSGGEITHFHVSFLGEPVSRAWVLANRISLYVAEGGGKEEEGEGMKKVLEWRRKHVTRRTNYGQEEEAGPMKKPLHPMEFVDVNTETNGLKDLDINSANFTIKKELIDENFFDVTEDEILNEDVMNEKIDVKTEDSKMDTKTIEIEGLEIKDELIDMDEDVMNKKTDVKTEDSMIGTKIIEGLEIKAELIDMNEDVTNKKIYVKTEDSKIGTNTKDIGGLEIKDELIDVDTIIDITDEILNEEDRMTKDIKKTAHVVQPMNTKTFCKTISKKMKSKHDKPLTRSTANKQINNHRLASALSVANTATSMTRAERLEKYSFINKYKGRWNV